MIRWASRDLALVDHPYNTTILNERSVELAVAFDFLRQVSGDGLEVGNVTSHYRNCHHRVVDLFEEADGVENMDVFDISGSYDWILSISTVEHVYWDDQKNPMGGERAVKHLRSLLRPGGRMLVTVPLGWNPPLDERLPLGADVSACFWRDGDVWVAGGLTPATYGPSWANAVWIGEWS
jgi:SAM-dependent methyltransferase